METVPLKGRAAILSDMKNINFCDVVCGHCDCSHLTFSISSNGILCEFDENRSLIKVIELRVDRAYSIFADDDNLYIGCSAGTILIFKQNNLEFIASLPRPHKLGVDISKGLDTRHLIENLNNCDLKYPDCIALCYNTFDNYLCAIYNDHSLYIWDIKDVNKVKKIDSHLFHSSCCWSLDIFSNQTPNNTCLPNESFITCSNDNTLRIWSLENINNENSKSNNIYSKELMDIIYIDNDLSALCETDHNGNQQDNNNDFNSTNLPQQQQQQQQVNNNDQQSQINTIKLGARCLKISPFGCHLATGDRNGNIRIYDLKQLESIILIEAHESEILYLQYSQPESGRLLLASSSRDRLIHIFDARKNYELIQTLDDHSAAITATRFCYNQIEKQFYLISCGSDKSIIFRCAHEVPTNSSFNESKNNLNDNSSKTQFARSSFVCEKMTFYDLIVDPTKNYINTVSQDRIVRTYSIKDGKKLRQFKGSLNEDGYLLKMDIDRTGTLLATSCTDKCVYIWDLNTCECLAYICGHSELIIDLKFTFDNKYLITIGVDSCVFVWKLNLLANNLQQSSSSSSFTSSSRKTQVFNMNNNLIPAKVTSGDDFSLDFLIENNNNEKINLRTKSENETINKFVENEEDKPNNNNVRRSRAVWGPVCNTSFAIMVDNEIEEKSDNESQTPTKCNFGMLKNRKNSSTDSIINPITSELSLPAVQFPSPNVEKGLYTVVTVDSNLQKHKSLCLTIEDVKEDDLQDIPSTPTKENMIFYSPNKVLCNDNLFGQIMSPNLNDIDRKYLNTSSNSDSLNLRRQSLSARYLMKTQQPSTDAPPTPPPIIIKEQIAVIDDQCVKNEVLVSPSLTTNKNHLQISASTNNIDFIGLNNKTIPYIGVSSTTVLSAQMTADMLKIKKTKATNYLQATSLHFQHTESSLNKIKAKQQMSAEIIKLNKSPSMNSVASIVESVNECEDKCLVTSNDENNGSDFVINSQLRFNNSNKSSPSKVCTQTSVPITEAINNDNENVNNNNNNNLKKASSMISLNCATTHVPITSSSSFNSRPICQINGSNKCNNGINRVVSNGHNNNNNGVVLQVNQVITNNNTLPPKTVRQVKQKSTDRHVLSSTNGTNGLNTNGTNLEKNRARKLSSSTQNLQQVATEVQNKKPQRCSLYAKSSRKQRSNTEELLTTPQVKQNDNDEENKNVENFDVEFNNGKHSDYIAYDNNKSSPKLEKNVVDKVEEERVWNEFINNISLLESIHKQVGGKKLVFFL
jgi:WD40 repeat protein